MTEFTVAPGAALLIPSGTVARPDLLHLHVILTPACVDGLHLMVSISSIRKGGHFDPACVATAGEHPFIKTDSYAFYRRADMMHGLRIAKHLGLGDFRAQPNVSEELLRRISAGLERSLELPQRCLRFWLKNRPP